MFGTCDCFWAFGQVVIGTIQDLAIRFQMHQSLVPYRFTSWLFCGGVEEGDIKTMEKVWTKELHHIPFKTEY